MAGGARLDWEWPVAERHGRLGGARRGGVGLGSARQARHGMDRRGRARYGKAGEVWPVRVWHRWARFGKAGMDRRGSVRTGSDW